ncbi:MAG TPA: ribosomal protein S18-alanine N-acetyltransferase [Spirochaetota bacterium]|nr:ribosomal protein S18-alanine N-acetyltransferase [Spirochaetota bacterium]
MTEKGIHIRNAVHEDIIPVSEIENAVFHSPWSISNLEKERTASFSIFLVAETKAGSIVGYITAWNVHGEIQLNRIAVIDEYRRTGLGTILFSELLKACTPYHPSKILLEVRESNTAARNFYRSLGFIENGFRKNYYHDDNAVLLEYTVFQCNEKL